MKNIVESYKKFVEARDSEIQLIEEKTKIRIDGWEHAIYSPEDKTVFINTPRFINRDLPYGKCAGSWLRTIFCWLAHGNDGCGREDFIELKNRAHRLVEICSAFEKEDRKNRYTNTILNLDRKRISFAMFTEIDNIPLTDFSEKIQNAEKDGAKKETLEKMISKELKLKTVEEIMIDN